jgi:hypothetical protein
MRVFPLSGLIGLALLVSACSPPPQPEVAGSVSDHQEAVGTGSLAGTGSAEVAEVTEVAHLFLSALSAADTAALSGLLAVGAGIHSVREGEEGPVLRAVSREDFLEGLGAEDQQFLERMWDPTVQVQDGVATVWAPYDFHLAGEFSHCGIDIFTLLEGMEGWQVTNISYNVIREGCPPSPLGPPGRSGS